MFRRADQLLLYQMMAQFFSKQESCGDDRVYLSNCYPLIPLLPFLHLFHTITIFAITSFKLQWLGLVAPPSSCPHYLLFKKEKRPIKNSCLFGCCTFSEYVFPSLPRHSHFDNDCQSETAFTSILLMFLVRQAKCLVGLMLQLPLILY